jgi:hypothetical protein
MAGSRSRRNRAADALVSLRSSITTKGKVQIEDKQDWKSRLADAQLADVAYTCALVFDGWTRRGRVPDQRPLIWS